MKLFTSSKGNAAFPGIVAFPGNAAFPGIVANAVRVLTLVASVALLTVGGCGGGSGSGNSGGTVDPIVPPVPGKADVALYHVLGDSKGNKTKYGIVYPSLNGEGFGFSDIPPMPYGYGYSSSGTVPSRIVIKGDDLTRILCDQTFDLAVGKTYSLFLLGDASSDAPGVRPTIVAGLRNFDNLAAGKTRIRFVNARIKSSAIDIWFRSSSGDRKLFSNIPFGGLTDYADLPASTSENDVKFIFTAVGASIQENLDDNLAWGNVILKAGENIAYAYTSDTSYYHGYRILAYEERAK